MDNDVSSIRMCVCVYARVLAYVCMCLYGDMHIRM